MMMTQEMMNVSLYIYLEQFHGFMDSFGNFTESSLYICNVYMNVLNLHVCKF